jgi:hypothetical protein
MSDQVCYGWAGDLLSTPPDIAQAGKRLEDVLARLRS